MSKNFFIISKAEGKKFAKISGDYNKIHIDEKVGYNSIYGNIVCHGVLVLLKFLKKIKFQMDKQFNINIKFNKVILYNTKIEIKKKSNREYILIQNNYESAKVDMNLDNSYKDKIKVFNKTTEYKLSKFKKNYYKNINANLVKSLCIISKYVGTVYPGKNSMLNNININYNSRKKLTKDVLKIKSRLLDKRLPLIKNKLLYKNFIIFFDSAKRPAIQNKNTKLNYHLVNRIKKIKENIFIIGASQGIGKDVLKIVNKNNNIIKIATYFKNKIKSKNKRLIIKKIDINSDLKSINKIIKKYSPLRIFYFPTTKIIFDRKVQYKLEKEYEKFYVLFPLKILKKNKNRKISFFYPSTKHIEIDRKSVYSRVKMKAEKRIKNYCNKNKIPLYIQRYPAINSRQSLSLINNFLPNLEEYLNTNKKSLNNIFPKNIHNV